MKEVNYLMELEAIWLGTGRNLEGSKRIQEGDLVAIDSRGVFITGLFATHKVLATFGDIWSTNLQVMLWDIINCQVILMKLK